MIYDGLEFGAFLEVPSDSPCFVLLRGLNPLLHAAFVFLQMYFIFISARVRLYSFHLTPKQQAKYLISFWSSLLVEHT